MYDALGFTKPAMDQQETVVTFTSKLGTSLSEVTLLVTKIRDEVVKIMGCVKRLW